MGNIVGFTGSREGMTMQQRYTFVELLRAADCAELHHGDCVGSDADAHKLAQALSPVTI